MKGFYAALARNPREKHRTIPWEGKGRNAEIQFAKRVFEPSR
jgi:hypothetical protein